MSNNDFEKSIGELDKLKNINNELIRQNKEKAKILYFNGLEFKTFSTLAFSLLSYLIIIIATIITMRIFDVSSITNIFPGFSYPVTLLGGSFGIGLISKSLIQKKNKSKERLKYLTSSRTYSKLLEEEMKYRIEMDKINSKNIALDETIDFMTHVQDIINESPKLNDITEIMTKEQMMESQNNLENNYEKLDIFTTQKFLSDKFSNVRDKYQSKFNIVMLSLFCAAITMTFTGFSSFLIKDVITSLGSFIIYATSFIAGAIGSSTYMIKKNKIYKQVFNNLNLELGDDSLNNVLSNENELEQITDSINNTVKNISVYEMQNQNYKRHLEHINVLETHNQLSVSTKEMTSGNENLNNNEIGKAYVKK